MSNITIEQKILDSEYNGPVTVEVSKDLEVTGLDSLVEFSTDMSKEVQKAATSATEAEASANTAVSKAAEATSEAAAAKKSAEDAAAVVTGGDATLEATPGKIPLADSKGHIDNGWLAPQLMTEAEAMAQADTYEQVFAASGMVHMGKHIINEAAGYGVINEGLHTDPTRPNYARLGRPYATPNTGGTSKSSFAVAYLAGVVTNLLDIDREDSITFCESRLLLPPAEAGTRIYDSTGNARGSGKATLDFRYDVDPKYGDVPTGTDAEVLREAVGRAFEGMVKNGDFRNGNSGDTYLTNKGSGSYTRNSGSATITAGDNFNIQVNLLSQDDIPTGDFIVEIYVIDFTGAPRVFHDPANNGYSQLVLGRNTFKLTKGVGSLWVQPQTGDGGYLTFTNLSVKPVTEEVVTHPVDLLTWESYDEELTGRTEVFECIQSLSDTFGTTDVPTVLSTRPNSYFDQYDGQSDDPDAQNTKYRCVVWDDLTDGQKRKVAAYMGNKLYIGENGYLVNRRLRARTFRGLGNGDWETIDPNGSERVPLGFLGGSAKIQGQLDAPSINLRAQYYPRGSNTRTQEVGVFNSRAHPDANGTAYKGRCFLYVVASVPRANQGAYHPSLNPWGCGKLANSSDGVTVNGDDFWYEGLVGKMNPTNQKDCFTVLKYGDAATSAGVYAKSNGDLSGSIAAGFSGHPDGIFHDGITAGGLNGLIDWRLSAFEGDSPEEAAKVQAKVENGTYRGLEKLVRTKVLKSEASDFKNPTGTIYRTSSTASSCFIFFASSVVKKLNETLNKGDVVRIHDTENGIYITGKISGFDITGNSLNLAGLRGYNGYVPETSSYASISDLSLLSIICESELNLSVSGEFNTSMVIGDPANILQTDALKDGWLGTWCPTIPTDSTKYLDFELTRKSVGNAVLPNTPYTDDNGATWSGLSVGITKALNKPSSTLAFPANRVTVWPYTAHAKMTKPSENKPVYNGKAGLMPVYVSNGYYKPEWGNLFLESILGKVGVGSLGTDILESLPLDKYLLSSVDGTLNTGVVPSHKPLEVPNNNSPAVKVLPYQLSDNGQCSIGYQANELTWDDSAPVVITSGNLGEDAVSGTKYRVEFGSGASVPAGFYVCLVSFSSRQWDSEAFATNVEGDVIDINTGIIWLKKINAADDWGDDGKIKITASGSDTFVDLNGNTNLSVAHELAIPHGWTKNRARAGEQVAGIDL